MVVGGETVPGLACGAAGAGEDWVAREAVREPIWMSWPVARMKRLKVWFLPEPTGILLLGTGMAALLGLARIRRR
jgi:hypothetical protein